ncbi:hypothetical protein DY000_02033738 [Brassica cretica]|uniref:Uncharacterized protein n=1 Tax=Brassica cretica TaxID=69181 RepID=A0ABQ7DXL1_BRACR|nr:hypothetical protein DY000_02033738 [Brassica cretica]
MRKRRISIARRKRSGLAAHMVPIVHPRRPHDAHDLPSPRTRCPQSALAVHTVPTVAPRRSRSALSTHNQPSPPTRRPRLIHLVTTKHRYTALLIVSPS